MEKRKNTDEKRVKIIRYYIKHILVSNHGECAPLLTENEVGSLPTLGANFTLREI